MNPNVRRSTAIFLMFMLCCVAYGATPSSHQVSVCQVTSRPTEYIGQTITVRGEVLVVPPHIPLQLRGLCKGKIYVILHSKQTSLVKNALFHKFQNDIWNQRSYAMVVQLTGTVKRYRTESGNQLLLYLKEVKDIRVEPQLKIVRAATPMFGLLANLPTKPEQVSMVITVKNGVVTNAQVKKHTGDALEDLALENVKTWQFAFYQSGTFTTVFSYRIKKATTLPLPVNPRVEMDLPSKVVITRFSR